MRAPRQDERLYRRRRLTNMVAVTLANLAAIFGLLFLAWIMWTLISRGIGHLDLALLTQDQPPPMEDGGLRNAIVGSLMMCAMAVLIGTPLGIAAGTWLAEFGHGTRLGSAVRFVNDILLSAPSIVLGLFVYAMFVMQTGGRFSAVAGALALAFIVLPVVVRSTDEMLRLVPVTMREAALSLGVPQWKMVLQVLYRSALPGIVTGVLLALARISGETAPLLFTAFGNEFFSLDPSGAMSAVPLVMYKFAGSGFENWERIAWAGALLTTLFVLAVSLIARAIVNRKRVTPD
ncbi:phosphate ABC transporter permease PstA [Luteimonas sp. e5]